MSTIILKGVLETRDLHLPLIATFTTVYYWMLTAKESFYCSTEQKLQDTSLR